jgi:putative nucleotidyltransferase with HDIG domain
MNNRREEMESSEQTALVKEVLKAAEKLPPFPDIVWKVVPLVQKMASVNEIEAVIKYDPVITAKVLSLSQSPQFGRRQNIANLKDAIVALGDQQLLMVIMAACTSTYYANDTSGYDLAEGELWEHAVATALMTEIVARKLGKGKILAAYTAALLHDIGKTVLNFYVNSYFDSILSVVREKKIRFLEAERLILGVDHQELGALIARKWRLPDEVVTAIAYHHCPMDAKESTELVGLIYVANRMVSALGIGCGVDGFLQPNQDEVFVEMGISSQMVEKFLADLIEAFQKTKKFIAA